MKYIYSKLNSDGDTYDHTEVRAAETNGNRIEWNSWGDHWVVSTEPLWREKTKYRAQVPDTYCVQESSDNPKKDKETSDFYNVIENLGFQHSDEDGNMSGIQWRQFAIDLLSASNPKYNK